MAAERRKRTQWYCGPKANCTRSELVELEATGKYVAEEKHDGVWALVTVENGVLVSAESRVGLLFEGADIHGLAGLRLWDEPVDAKLVGEIVADTVDGRRVGTRRLHLFDVAQLSGRWEHRKGYETLPTDLHCRRDVTLTQRRTVLEVSLDKGITSDRVFVVRQVFSGFQALFDEIIEADGEGIVIKKKVSYYRSTRASGKIDTWLRCKPKRCIDYVCTGHGVAEKGTPNLTLALWKKLTTGLRLAKTLTVAIPKELEHIEPEQFVGRVLEVTGAELFPSGAVRHAHVLRIRDDKKFLDCTLEAAMDAKKIA